MSNIDKFKKLYNFEFEEIKVDSFEEVSKKYLTLYKEGKEKGYIPLFLTVDEYLLKTFKITMANENVDNMIDIFDKNLEKAKSINPIEFLEKFQGQNTDDLKENIEGAKKAGLDGAVLPLPEASALRKILEEEKNA